MGKNLDGFTDVWLSFGPFFMTSGKPRALHADLRSASDPAAIVNRLAQLIMEVEAASAAPCLIMINPDPRFNGGSIASGAAEMAVDLTEQRLTQGYICSAFANPWRSICVCGGGRFPPMKAGGVLP